MTTRKSTHARKITQLSVLSLFLAVSTVQSAWLEDYAKAKKQAQTEKKDLLLNFGGSDWCVWCQKLDKEVFHKKDFIKQAEKDFVLVHLDFPTRKEQAPALKQQNEKLKAEFTKKYGFPGFPTVFLTDAEGVAYAKTGYQAGGPEAYLENLEKLKKARPLEDPGAEWLENYEVAKAKAAALNKDLLINFSGSDWCGWCIRLDKEVFDQEYFKEHAPNDFVLLKLDFPRRSPQAAYIKAQNEKLYQTYSTQYGLRGFPSIYLAKPNGEPYGMSGYGAGGPENYLKKLLEAKKDQGAKQSG